MLFSCLSAPGLAADGLTWTKEKNQVTAFINWCTVATDRKDCALPPATALDEKPRIDSDSAVAIEVSSFNFLYYNVEYSIEEKQIEAYAYLAGLWDQFLGFDITNQLGIAGEGAEWWKVVRTLRAQLKQMLATYAGSAGLTQTQLKSLAADRDVFLKQVVKLDALRAKAFDAANTVEDLQRFDIVDKDHTTLVEAINTFAALALRCQAGDRKNVGKKGAGTYVTVSITPKPLPATEQTTSLGAVSTEYLVESVFPLMFHAGLTYNELRDAKFQTVQALDGRDLFVKVRDEKGVETFSAYLSYPLDDPSIDKARWFATLGTDLKDIGDNIYVGISARIKSRWFISVGGVYGLEKEGQGQTTEAAQGAVEARTLYEIAKEERAWAAFASVSVKIY